MLTASPAASPYAGQRIAILGLARQGVALARYLAQAGAGVVVSDQQPAAKLAEALAALSGLPIEFALGGHPESLLDGADLLCLSGGVPTDLPIVAAARRRGVALSNDSQIFLEVCPPGVRVVGITGSAGKTTTTTLVGRMLAAQAAARGGEQVFIGGNIGNPLIAQLAALRPGDRVVIELSSFQLELMTRSPEIAAVLNITPNHLDRHGTMLAYTEAKSHILRHQTPEGLAVLGLDDPGARGLTSAAPGQVAYFSAEQAVRQGAYLAEQTLMFRWLGAAQPVAPVAAIELRGRHNVLNALAAIAISGAAGAGPAAMRAGLEGFRGVPHRLEPVRELNGARWYNDSIATAPERVLAALRSFDEPLVLLLGGRDKKLPWGELAALVGQRVKRAVLFGEAGPLIEQALIAAGVPAAQYTRRATLAEAVDVAAQAAAPGDVVLLAPGGTGYDEFRDFAERGDKFRQWVLAL
ncbi:MAG: UDP-N-acetylmuramoyl-L-alanine--D-glutamate ligase [Anaerolineales bacterium]|nr:UDP-N-acetylmuramoyl-L-alanine--D-glutamate ligase [Anaerolineales bacterium]